MSDERRERYAAALWEASDSYCPYENGVWTTDRVDADNRSEMRRMADAAMAVADEEIRAAKLEAAQIVAANYVAERSRLRAELEQTHAKGSATSEHLDGEVTRLRAELASSKAAHRAVWKLHQARGQRIFDLQGENARLRAELEEMRDGALNEGENQ